MKRFDPDCLDRSPVALACAVAGLFAGCWLAMFL